MHEAMWPLVRSPQLVEVRSFEEEEVVVVVVEGT